MMRYFIFLAVFIFFSALVAPENAFAGTHANVTLYITGGFVAGGVAVFFTVILGSDRHHSKKEKNPDDKNDSSPGMNAFNFQSAPAVEEYVSQAGMAKVFEW